MFTGLSSGSTLPVIEIGIVETLTCVSHEKYPFWMDMAGIPGTRGGLGFKILSSAKNSSCKRCNDTFAFTACQNTE